MNTVETASVKPIRKGVLISAMLRWPFLNLNPGDAVLIEPDERADGEMRPVDVSVTV